MSPIEYAEFVSLMLTAPTVILGIFVVYNYAPRALAAVRERHLSESQLLIAGITVGFLGGVVDNIYWGLAWGAEYLKLPSRDLLFNNGVWSNIVFRQATGIIAALFHLWPIVVLRGERYIYLRWALGTSLAAGAALVGLKVYL